MSATLADVEDVLESRREWLLEKLYGLAEQAEPPYPKEFLSGEKLPYRGREYHLDVVEADVPEPHLSFDGTEFTLCVHGRDAAADHVSVRRKRQAVVDWYVRRAAAELPARSPRFESQLGLADVSIEIEVGTLDGRWGEYDDGIVRLHWRLLLAPVRIHAYVLVHELAHAVHDDHSDAFWNTVGTVIPDYEDSREWLRLNGNTLRI